jgi:hypothetical protein
MLQQVALAQVEGMLDVILIEDHCAPLHLSSSLNKQVSLDGGDPIPWPLDAVF